MTDFYPTITASIEQKATPEKALITPHPPTPTTPTKIDIIWDLIQERERLKQIREDITTGQRKADKELTAEMYLTQLVISANKTVIDALKETKINVTNNFNQIDITQQINELIEVSEMTCNGPSSPEDS
jgi:hypothetical protein